MLAIDVGNATTAFALWRDDVALLHWRLRSLPDTSTDEMHSVLSALMAESGVTRNDVAGSVLACVVPELLTTVTQVVNRILGTPPLVVAPGVRTGIPVNTEDPREVGADRIANAVAATARFGSPVLVVDFGTSINVDVIDRDGAYIGALIAPGMDVAADGLAHRAAGLRRVALTPPGRAIADNTDDALRSGLALGYVGLVEGLIESARGEVGPAPVIATGTAPWVASLVSACSAIDHYDELLTLDGLRLIYERTMVKPVVPLAR